LLAISAYIPKTAAPFTGGGFDSGNLHACKVNAAPPLFLLTFLKGTRVLDLF
jgi:hypothetical protein